MKWRKFEVLDMLGEVMNQRHLLGSGEDWGAIWVDYNSAPPCVTLFSCLGCDRENIEFIQDEVFYFSLPF